MRGRLWRASKVCPAPPRQALKHAEKSIAASTGGIPDFAEITGAVARRNIHAATQRDRQIREVAADALLFGDRQRWLGLSEQYRAISKWSGCRFHAAARSGWLK